MRRNLAIIAVVAVVALSGCAGFGGGSDPVGTETDTELPDSPADAESTPVQAGNNTTAATNANYTLRIEVNESAAGSELGSVGATFPREQFLVDGAKHEAVSVGVDTDGDGTVDRAFDEGDVSGVNNNDFSFDVTLDTGYTLEQGDVVVFQYPAISNPDEPGEYSVAVRLNGDQQRAAGNIRIG